MFVLLSTVHLNAFYLKSSRFFLKVVDENLSAFRATTRKHGLFSPENVPNVANKREEIRGRERRGKKNLLTMV